MIDELTMLEEIGLDEGLEIEGARAEVWRRLGELEIRRSLQFPRKVLLIAGAAAGIGVIAAAVVLSRSGAPAAAAVCGKAGPPPLACGRALAALAEPGAAGGARRIVFSRFAHDRTAQLYSMNADGSDVRRLTSGPYRNAFPAVSPDGTRIAFTRSSPKRGLGTAAIYVMRPDGSRQHLVATGTPILAWSPDGSKLAFWRWVPGLHPGFGIYVVDAAGAVRLVRRHAMYPTWSPDGTKLAFTSVDTSTRVAISVMNADGTDPRVLAPHAYGPAWSPDGKTIAYLRFGGWVDHAYPVWAMNADGTHRTSLGVRASEDCNLAWSPDSRRIAFGTVDGLFLIGPTGKNLRKLASGDDCGIAW